MLDSVTKLLAIYFPLVGLGLLGFILGRYVPKVVPTYLGQLLFWVGVPVSIIAFLRHADLSGPIWIAPLIAWVAIFGGAGLAWVGMKWGEGGRGGVEGFLRKGVSKALWSKATQGSFLLTAMVGNTGYLGYPISLAMVGSQYFGWAIFYDLLGTTLAAYGLGAVLGAHFGNGHQNQQGQLWQAILINPALWSFGLGLASRNLSLGWPVEQLLQGIAWTAVALSLVLMGMRLSQLNSWHNLPRVTLSLGIKMLLVPFILGCSLPLFGLTGPKALVIVLQMAMPPAFACLVLAEVYHLDHDLTVTALAVGNLGLLVTLPIWLWLFGG